MDFIIIFFMSIDTLLACFSLGSKNISISMGARIVIASIGTLCLALSLIFSAILSAILPKTLFNIISCLTLFLIATFCIFEAFIKQLSTKLVNKSKKLTLKLNDFYIMMEICSDTSKADTDHSGILSPLEAISLSIPLSLDSLLTGLSLTNSHYILMILFSFFCGFFSTFIGHKIGKKFAKVNKERATILSGIILMIIAGFKMVYN